MITAELLRAAPEPAHSFGVVEFGDGWISNNAWAAKSDLLRPEGRGEVSLEAGQEWLKRIHSLKRYLAKEVRRGKDPGAIHADRTEVRVYSAKGGLCVLFETMATLLDGYRVVRLGDEKLGPLGGLNEAGELVVVCRPTAIDSRTVTP